MTARPLEPSDNRLRSQAQNAAILIGVVLFSAGIILLAFLPGQSWLAGIRWVGLVCLSVGGIRKRSLTYWIFFALLLGGEIGVDHPGFAEHLRFLSDIFLRLIK